MLTGGFYNKAELSPKQGYRIFNTWVGDPGKVVLLDAVLKTVKKDNLLDNTLKSGECVWSSAVCLQSYKLFVYISGEVLMTGIKNLEKKYPGLVHSTRGIGTFIAFDADTSARYKSSKKNQLFVYII